MTRHFDGRFEISRSSVQPVMIILRVDRSRSVEKVLPAPLH